MEIAALIKLIDQEIAWCENNPGGPLGMSSVSPEFRDGFIRGLRQAQFLIKSADREQRRRVEGALRAFAGLPTETIR